MLLSVSKYCTLTIPKENQMQWRAFRRTIAIIFLIKIFGDSCEKALALFSGLSLFVSLRFPWRADTDINRNMSIVSIPWFCYSKAGRIEVNGMCVAWRFYHHHSWLLLLFLYAFLKSVRAKSHHSLSKPWHFRYNAYIFIRKFPDWQRSIFHR